MAAEPAVPAPDVPAAPAPQLPEVPVAPAPQLPDALAPVAPVPSSPPPPSPLGSVLAPATGLIGAGNGDDSDETGVPALVVEPIASLSPEIGSVVEDAIVVVAPAVDDTIGSATPPADSLPGGEEPVALLEPVINVTTPLTSDLADTVTPVLEGARRWRRRAALAGDR